MARNEDEIDSFTVVGVCVLVLCLFLCLGHLINSPIKVGPGIRIGEVVVKEEGTTHSEIGIRIEVGND